MGLDVGWKALLRDEFGWPGMSDEAASAITVVIDDLSLNLRRILAGVDSWKVLGDRVRARVEKLAQSGKLKEYWALSDESLWVPPNKAVTQRLRSERGRAEPFTPEEQNAIQIGVDPIPTPANVFFERLLATRSMHASLHMFITAELALADIPTGVKLVLDGSRARLIMDRQMKGSPVQLFNVRVPASEFEVMSPIEQGKVDHPARLTITRSLTREGVNSVYVHPSNQIGESDLKIATAITEQEDGAQIFVRSCDGDMLAILLLHMRGYIGKNNTIKYGIYVDTDGPGRGADAVPTPALDMPEMWRMIGVRFQKMWPTVPRGCWPETFAMLMLLSGSDYADRLPQVGVRAVWDAFVDPIGRATLFPPDRPGQPGIVVEDVVGQPQARVQTLLNEHNVWRFIAYIYHKKTLRNTPFPATLTYSLDDARAVREVVRQKVLANGKELTSRNGWQVPSDASLMASIRRLYWNIDYFSNGSKCSVGPFFNPFTVHEHTGMSVYGWVQEAPTQKGVKPVVRLAEAVSPP